ncbi:MAG: ArsR/SmtB family transcription factor [Candidatus Limnocylindria bacterium]
MTTNQEAMSALGDSTRAAIFDRLRHGPAPVVELARGLPVSRPAVSQHLRVLLDAGLVTARRDGTRRIYAVDPTGVREVRDYFDEMWRTALAAFKEAADRAAGDAGRVTRRTQQGGG